MEDRWRWRALRLADGPNEAWLQSEGRLLERSLEQRERLFEGQALRVEGLSVVRRRPRT